MMKIRETEKIPHLKYFQETEDMNVVGQRRVLMIEQTWRVLRGVSRVADRMQGFGTS